MSSFQFNKFVPLHFIFTLNLLFEICFCRFLVSCPPFGIVTLFVKVWLNNLLFKFWFCLPMDWDFSSLPWDESFLKGGSHFLAQGNSVCHLYLFSLHVMISLHNWFEKKILKIFDRKAFIFSVSKRWKACKNFCNDFFSKYSIGKPASYTQFQYILLIT